MPEYLAPGVFVEEVSFRQKSIEGVGTSVAGIAGPTRFGPVRGKPLLCTSMLDFERYFGNSRNLRFGQTLKNGETDPDTGTIAVNHTAYAANAFFANGGKQLFVSRVLSGGGGVASDAALGTARFAVRSIKLGDAGDAPILNLHSRFPGAAGNFDLVFTPRQMPNLLEPRAIAAADLKDGDKAYVVLSDVDAASVTPAPAGGGNDPVYKLRSLAGVGTFINADKTWSFAGTSILAVVDANGKHFNDTAATLAVATVKQNVATDSQRQVGFRQDSAAVDKAVYSLAIGPEVGGLLGAGALTGAPDTLVATLNKTDGTLTLPKAANGLANDVTLPLDALAAMPARTPARLWRRSYAVEAELDGRVLFELPAVSLDPASPDWVVTGMPAKPQKLSDDLTLPVRANVTANPAEAAAVIALEAAFDPLLLKPSNRAIEPRRVIHLGGGTDGDEPVSADYRGDADEQLGSTGFAAMEDVDEISIVLAPAAAATSREHYRAIIAELQIHLRRMRYRVGIIDSQRNMTISEIRDFRSDLSDDRLALYYPWVRVAGLIPEEWDELQLPPSGFMAGIYAGTDVRRGVHKAPANEVVLGVIGLEAQINTFQQELLNPIGINCLRSFPNRGIRVWGGRTLSADPEWKYINVRRYFLFLEKSIERATDWAVFEPNGEDLWANVKATVSDFLYNEWFSRHLLGATPEQAFFVRCDRGTMTQNDLDNGRLVCLIGVAPLRPAEFVIFRIGQKTADAK